MKDYYQIDIQKQLCNLPQLVFEITDACNLKCKYCGYGEFYEDYDDRKNLYMPIQKAIKILEYLRNLWLSNHNQSLDQKLYISFYGGEPLMNMSFVEKIVTWVKENKIPNRTIIFSMTTNGVLLDKYIDYLVEHDFRLLISLDGNEKNNSYRVNHSNENSFNTVFGNIKLMQRKHLTFFDKNVNFNAVLHNRNSVKETYSFIKLEFNKTPRIAELNNSGIRYDKIKEFNTAYKNKYESLQQADNYELLDNELFMDSPETADLAIFLHQYSGNVFKSYNDFFIREKDKKYFPTGTCLPFSKKLFITVNGKILPCERIGHQFALGEITDYEVKLDFKGITDNYNKWYSKLKNQCSKCYNIKACTQCVFTLDNIDNNPSCQGFMDKNKFGVYSNNQMRYLEKHPHLYKKIMNEVLIG